MGKRVNLYFYCLTGCCIGTSSLLALQNDMCATRSGAFFAYKASFSCPFKRFSLSLQSKNIRIMPNKEENHLLHLFSHCPVCGAKTFAEDTEKSKRCKACGFQYFMNPSASTVAIIVDEMGRLLSVRRSKEPAKGTLDLPGGFCDCNETAEEGVRREVLEETGLIVTEARYLFSLPNRYLYCGLNIPTLDLFFLCKAKDTTGATAMDDAAEVLWLPWDKVNPSDFGLKSISLGVERLLQMHAENPAIFR